MKQEFLSTSAEMTEQIGEQLAKTVKPNGIIALFGGLGMGKTAFCRGFARGMNYDGEVSSPTFAIVHEYAGGRLNVYHFDMYRVETYDELYSTGYFEYAESGGAVIIEWSENIEAILPDDCIRVEFYRTNNENERKIVITTAD